MRCVAPAHCRRLDEAVQRSGVAQFQRDLDVDRLRERHHAVDDVAAAELRRMRRGGRHRRRRRALAPGPTLATRSRQTRWRPRRTARYVAEYFAICALLTPSDRCMVVDRRERSAPRRMTASPPSASYRSQQTDGSSRAVEGACRKARSAIPCSQRTFTAVERGGIALPKERHRNNGSNPPNLSVSFQRHMHISHCANGSRKSRKRVHRRENAVRAKSGLIRCVHRRVDAPHARSMTAGRRETPSKGRMRLKKERIEPEQKHGCKREVLHNVPKIHFFVRQAEHDRLAAAHSCRRRGSASCRETRRARSGLSTSRSPRDPARCPCRRTARPTSGLRTGLTSALAGRVPTFGAGFVNAISTSPGPFTTIGTGSVIVVKSFDRCGHRVALVRAAKRRRRWSDRYRRPDRRRN